LIKVIHYVLHL